MMLQKHSLVVAKTAVDVPNAGTSTNLVPRLPSLVNGQTYSGLVIGDQKGSEEQHTHRKIAQAAYKGQLEEDVEKKSITRICSVHRSSLCKVAIHEEYLTGLNLGKDAETDQQNKKSAARNLLAQSLIDSDEKAGAALTLIEKQHKQELPGIFAIGVEEKRVGKGKKKFLSLPSSVSCITNGIPVGEELRKTPQICSGKKKVMIPTVPLTVVTESSQRNSLWSPQSHLDKKTTGCHTSLKNTSSAASLETNQDFDFPSVPYLRT